QELALDLQDLDHLEQAAAGRVHRPRPRPGARIALVADLRDLGEIHRADEVGDVGGRGIVRRIGADAGARGLGEEHPLDRNPDEVAFVIALDEVARPGRELAADEDAVELALEELPRARALGGVGLRRAPVPAQHVPDVFVTAAGESRGVARQYVAQKLVEGAFPALRAVQAAEGAQGVDEVGGSAAGSLLSRALSHRPSLPLGPWCSSTMPAIPATPATPAWCLR